MPFCCSHQNGTVAIFDTAHFPESKIYSVAFRASSLALQFVYFVCNFSSSQPDLERQSYTHVFPRGSLALFVDSVSVLRIGVYNSFSATYILSAFWSARGAGASSPSRAMGSPGWSRRPCSPRARALTAAPARGI